MKVNEFILPGKSLLIVTALVILVLGVEVALACFIADFTKVADVACNLKSVDTEEDPVTLTLDCGGKEVVTAQSQVVVSYLRNPGPVTCTIYKLGKAVCKPRRK